MYGMALILFGLSVAKSTLEEISVANGLMNEQARAVLYRLVTLMTKPSLKIGFSAGQVTLTVFRRSRDRRGPALLPTHP
jgi:hypothetical protein